MEKAKKSVGIVCAERPLQESAAIVADAKARIQQSLVHARNLGEFIVLINLEMSEVLAD
jgi:hypothetical protein